MKDKYFFHHLNSRFFEISGKDSKSFIQNLITNDIEKCNDGSIIYSCLLTPQGKFLADFFIFNINENYIFETNEKFFDNLLSLISLTSSQLSHIEKAVAFDSWQLEFLHATKAFLLSIL